MNSKQRKEKSCSIHGTRSILSAFISRRWFVIKPYHSYVTNRASASYLFRYFEQFGYVKKKKNAQWKSRRHKSILFISNESRSVTINGVPDYILKSVQYKKFPQSAQYKQFPQSTQYEQFRQKEKKGTKEKDIMKSRQERGEEEKKMGTKERERKRSS